MKNNTFFARKYPLLDQCLTWLAQTNNIERHRKLNIPEIEEAMQVKELEELVGKLPRYTLHALVAEETSIQQAVIAVYDSVEPLHIWLNDVFEGDLSTHFFRQ